MEPAAGPRMYSNLTLFWLLTADFLILLFGLYGLYQKAKKRERVDFQKTYFLIGVLIIAVYVIFMPYALITNP